MNNMPVIEEYYNKYIIDIYKWAPDGIIEVGLDLLHRMNLLGFHPGEIKKEDDALTRYFHVIESMEKITLINDEYVIWIVPDNVSGTPVTYGLIALNRPKGPQLELVFSTSGVYNNSWLVLRILEKFLKEIHENEDIISQYDKSA